MYDRDEDEDEGEGESESRSRLCCLSISCLPPGAPSRHTGPQLQELLE